MARSRHCIRKCSKVSEHNEQRIVDAYEDNEDFILLAVVLEINKTTQGCHVIYIVLLTSL